MIFIIIIIIEFDDAFRVGIISSRSFVCFLYAIALNTNVCFNKQNSISHLFGYLQNYLPKHSCFCVYRYILHQHKQMRVHSKQIANRDCCLIQIRITLRASQCLNPLP